MLDRHDEAIEALQEALIVDAGAQDFLDALSKSKNALLLSDLAAAHHARGRYFDTPQDFVIALDAAERAWAVAKTPEAAWNRSLAIESLHDRAAAVAAWTDYLAVESDPLWTQPVRERLARFGEPTESQVWESSLDELRTAALHGDRKTVVRIVRRYPQQSRVWGEDELLYQWASVTAKGDLGDAGEALSVAEAVGAALEETMGESMLRESSAAIRRSGAALVQAHLDYRNAQDFDRQLRTKEAAGSWRSAAERLRRYGSPLFIRATTFGATATYLLGDGPTATTNVDPFIAQEDLQQRYPAAVAQARWLRALIRCASGRQAEGIEDYRKALALFERIGESDNVAGVHARLAANLGYIGQTEEAWAHRAAAFRILDVVGRSSRMQPLLVDTARAAEQSGYVVAALRFHDRLVEASVDDPVWRVESLRGRSVARWKAGRLQAAMFDLNAAMTEATRLPDASRRERAIANVRSAESLLVRETEPQRAVEAATEAIGFYQRVTNRMRLADLYMDRAQAHDRRGDLVPAASDLEAAAGVLEEQRRNLRTPADRQSFHERRRTLFETGAALFVRRNDFDGALAFGETARARTVLDAMDELQEDRGADQVAMNAASLAARVPKETTLLWYAVLPDRLVTTVLQRGSIRGSVQPIGRRRLEALVQRAAETCARADAEASCREASAALYDLLIRPVAGDLQEKLAVVPDAMLHAVALPALFDARRGRYLVEDHEIVLAPSARIFVEHAARPQPPLREAVLIGNPTFDAALFPDLPLLSGADAEVRRLAPLYPAAQVFMGREATRETLLEAGRRGALIHFAGHAIFDAVDGTKSALVLAAAGKGDDGSLSAAEIVRTPMSQVPLVVLSACGTWKRADAGGAALGFAEVFLRAGVHAVVASLSAVDDASASRVVIAFHEAFLIRPDAAAALRAAQLRLIHHPDPQLRSPRTWGSFIVVV